MKKIAEIITPDIKTVAVAGHVRPDGDCVGSCMGLYLYLKENYPQLEVHVYMESIRDIFQFIKCSDEIISECPQDFSPDLLITCDASSSDRIGILTDVYSQAKKTVCIDHHVSNLGFAMVNHVVPESSSASEVIYELLEDEKISKNTAEALYTGIVHDTGMFQFSCTSSRTMEIAGKLMDKDIPFSWIIDTTFNQKTYVQNQILGRTILESILLMDGRVIVGGVHAREMDFYKVTPKDLDGIVNQMRITKGVEVAIFFYESGNHEFKVSMRSNGIVDVSKIAGYFNGGGHVKAAGCTMQGSVYDVINNLTPYIEEQLNEGKKLD
ncbi:MAG: bifunctional oligoribonuclease/PAP phosphatase NrnA [Lachnospiraceae bacterium]|nr:bifunctional oligoribonuclease/PAP phosphatase NrnA [Lachnospiraceae bacterium]MDD3614615.1 bifunctional oligoribonuclease/PAP phosphatase NrnA [Lachnospiraceae bacterium]